MPSQISRALQVPGRSESPRSPQTVSLATTPPIGPSGDGIRLQVAQNPNVSQRWVSAWPGECHQAPVLLVDECGQLERLGHLTLPQRPCRS
ncbi:hypothetical protein LIA77_10994 [Sarocladium implicatum]|nr:hypothetical protein LIA77_10994 [Sarocladium implicatum]